MTLTDFRKPDIYITQDDYDRLDRLLPTRGLLPLGARLLMEEMDRANISSSDQEAQFVKLHSTIVYKDLESGKTRTVTLGLPKDADIDCGVISVLSPVGAALLGLPEGKRFEWIDASSRTRHVEIYSISSAPAE